MFKFTKDIEDLLLAIEDVKVQVDSIMRVLSKLDRLESMLKAHSREIHNLQVQNKERSAFDEMLELYIKDKGLVCNPQNELPSSAPSEQSSLDG